MNQEEKEKKASLLLAPFTFNIEKNMSNIYLQRIVIIITAEGDISPRKAN